jgi:hypothetical protein
LQSQQKCFLFHLPSSNSKYGAIHYTSASSLSVSSLLVLGHATSHAVNHRPITAEVRIRSLDNTLRIVVEKWQIISECFWFYPVSIIPLIRHTYQN